MFAARYLRSANITCGFLASNVLFSCLQCKSIARSSIGIPTISAQTSAQVANLTSLTNNRASKLAVKFLLSQDV